MTPYEAWEIPFAESKVGASGVRNKTLVLSAVLRRGAVPPCEPLYAVVAVVRPARRVKRKVRKSKAGARHLYHRTL